MNQTTDNYRKHTTKSSLLQFKFFQKFLIGRFLNLVVEETRGLHPESILDVGCGEGFTLKKLKDNHIGKKFEGIDNLDSAIAIGNKVHPDITIKNGDIYDISYKDNSFDLVLCTEVLEHLEDPEKALKELKRVTKKYCLISVPHEPWFMLGNFLRGKNWSRWGNDIEHINHWSTGGITKFVEKEFKIKKVRTPLPWTILIAEKR
jgi:2-polyprenyl-3-methyl-5-hydroxy-6-metoxy-1,4-benzoquinol methylase